MTAKNTRPDTTDQSNSEHVQETLSVLREQYADHLRTTTQAFHAAQHELHRASHEMTRTEKHLRRIDEFCQQHNVRLETA